MEKFTDKNLITKEALLEELRKIRNQGYAFDDEERMIGGPLHSGTRVHSHKEVIGAVGISGVLQTMSDSEMLKHAAYIKEVADHMSVVLEMNLSIRY